MSTALLKTLHKTILTLTLGVSMNADAGLFGNSKGWKEEVQLHDGQTIVVERSYNLGGYRGLESRERAELDQTLTFKLPGSSLTITWKTQYRDDTPEPNSLTALLLNVVNGVPYLATSPAGCIAYNKWGRPNPPYIFFKYVNDAWQRIALEEFPAMLTRPNLHPNPDTRLLKSYYSKEATKAEWESGNRHVYVKTILREAVKGGDAITSCLELILYKDAWIMPNDPVMRAILDRKSK
jgi:hypothetical protein